MTPVSTVRRTIRQTATFNRISGPGSVYDTDEYVLFHLTFSSTPLTRRKKLLVNLIQAAIQEFSGKRGQEPFAGSHYNNVRLCVYVVTKANLSPTDVERELVTIILKQEERQKRAHHNLEALTQLPT